MDIRICRHFVRIVEGLSRQPLNFRHVATPNAIIIQAFN
jgi:hypothetical protein